MRHSLEFLLGVIDRQEPPVLAREDLDGEHASDIEVWRERGFLHREPGMNPVPGCPHCGEGVPYPVSGRYLCSRCHETVDCRHLLLWELDLEAFLGWLAGALQLHGGVRRIDESLWQLGTGETQGIVREFFYRKHGTLSELGKSRLSAFRSALLLYVSSPPAEAEQLRLPSFSLLELLRDGDPLTVLSFDRLLAAGGAVRFDLQSGTLWAGDRALGEVPVGSKECFFLECLTSHLDHFVAYADLKYFILQKSGSRDTTEEATFCQRLKNRIKKKWIPRIDLLIAKTNKADGYRLRGCVELSGVG